jgi:hypothetical protein
MLGWRGIWVCSEGLRVLASGFSGCGVISERSGLRGGRIGGAVRSGFRRSRGKGPVWFWLRCRALSDGQRGMNLL